MNKTKMFCSALFIMGMLSIGSAQIEQDSIKVEQLNEVVLSDTRFPIRRENSGKVITKITSKDLDKLQGQSIAEIIGRTVGVEVNGVRSNAGQNLLYFVRGGRNRQVLIMIDGVQVTDPSQIANDYDLRLLNADQVESIEILKGASSTLYGTGAASAVINIKLKEASKKAFNLNLRSIIGTNQSSDENNYALEDFRNSISINGTIGKFNYLASFGQQFTDGLSAIQGGQESDAFNSYNANVKLGYRFSNKFKINTYVSLDNYKADFDEGFALMDADNVAISKQHRIGLSPELKYKNGSFTVNAAYNQVERQFESSFPSRFNAQSVIVDAFNRYNITDKFYAVLGLNYQDNKMESFSIPYGQSELSQSIDPELAQFTITDPYVNAVYISDFGLNINAGLRLNNHSEYGSHLVYSVNPSYAFDLDFGYIKGLASYSTAFITPSLFQLFEPSFGNASLEPEENQTIEFGTEVAINDKAIFSLVYFSRNENNFIDFVDTGGFVFRYQNIEESFTASGLEFVAQASLTKNLDLNLNVTYTSLNEDLSLRIPEIKLNTRLDYTLDEKTQLSLAYQYNDDREDAVFNNTTFETESVNLDAFGLLDFYVSHKILDNRMTLFANISNIFNVYYQELFGFTTRGRNLNLGINVNL
ncbi:TonB-dependent receptor plug domain-containing protein [Winogradskyella alexanderae]|uniref:TonB-dependent receptor plug domain-containing protein n=1 Tax=Winogradskyella alexanderae TaxID=2877123 RepID=A0ABS7XS53_9FLAO|nr:TonB-dependent receptor plug domain-containing protein [Winogradskyella alexanderae]MCA0132233.1 TonB-dependent receptor plug domain-containing protein [Winogradskyella alexanderae]